MLHGDRCFDGRVRIVTFESEVFVFEIEEIFHVGVQCHHGKSTWFAGELELGLLDMIRVEMEVAKGVDELAGLEVADLSDHEGEDGVASDVEGHAQEEVGAALVELTTEFALGDEELKQAVAGWQCHLIDDSYIPGADNVSAAVGIGLDAFDELFDLINGLGSGCTLPASPLRTIDGAEVAIFICPFVPDADFVFLEITNVGVATEEPKKFMNDAAKMKLLGGDDGESCAEIIAALLAKNGIGTSARAVLTVAAVGEDFMKEALVFEHK